MSSLSDLRREAGGRFLQLPSGLTYLVDEGQDQTGTIVLVHGATVPHWEFDRLVPHLRAAGLRVVCFDLFGHGLSDRPAVDYSFDLFLQQALAVLDSLHATAPITILGHSFGAALAAQIANVRPTLVVVTNFSLMKGFTRVEIPFEVSSNSDLARVIETVSRQVSEMLATDPDVDSSRPIQVVCTEIESDAAEVVAQIFYRADRSFDTLSTRVLQKVSDTLLALKAMPVHTVSLNRK